MEIKRSKYYRTRNGQIFWIEPLPTTFYIQRQHLEDHLFCAEKGLHSWTVEGKYGLVTNNPHELDLVEEIEEGYQETAVERLTRELEEALYDKAVKEMEKPVSIVLDKKTLLFLAALVGGTQPQKAAKTVRSSVGYELWNDRHWKPFFKNIAAYDANKIYKKLLGVINEINREQS